MKSLRLALAAAPLLLATASPASAGELFGGVYVHDVDLGLTKSNIEEGGAVLLGWRGEKIGFLKAIGGPRPHAYASVNTSGNTHFASAGISWKIGKTVYLRPGVGLAVHSGPGQVVPGDDRIDFGSRFLFAPELGLGARISDSMSIEASWVHLSHAQLFGRQNPGLDNVGIRFNYRFR
jgi:hypothetical protein